MIVGIDIYICRTLQSLTPYEIDANNNDPSVKPTCQTIIAMVRNLGGVYSNNKATHDP